MIALALALLIAAQPGECPFPAQKPMLVIQLYFGLNIANGRQVTDAEWRDFLAKTVTPRFPDGFTVYDAAGQWRDETSAKVEGERTKVMEIATEDTPAVHDRIPELPAPPPFPAVILP